MFGFGKRAEFDEIRESIREATDRLRRNMKILRDIVGVKPDLMDLWELRRANVDTLSEVMSTALASIEVLSRRVGELEKRG